MAAPSYHIACGFKRRIIDSPHSCLIESICVVCQHVIVGTVMDGLREAEAEHRDQCGIPQESEPQNAKSC